MHRELFDLDRVHLYNVSDAGLRTEYASILVTAYIACNRKQGKKDIYGPIRLERQKRADEGELSIKLPPELLEQLRVRFEKIQQKANQDNPHDRHEATQNLKQPLDKTKIHQPGDENVSSNQQNKTVRNDAALEGRYKQLQEGNNQDTVLQQSRYGSEMTNILPLSATSKTPHHTLQKPSVTSSTDHTLSSKSTSALRQSSKLSRPFLSVTIRYRIVNPRAGVVFETVRLSANDTT